MKQLYRWIVWLLIVAALAAPALPAWAAPPRLVIHQVYFSVRDATIFVSWSTDEACHGVVTYGTAPPPSGPVHDALPDNLFTHYVAIPGLTPGATYYLQVECGGVIDDNGGAYYTVTTGPTLGGTTPFSVGGVVNQAGGSVRAPYPLVYLRLVDRDGLGTPGVSQWGVIRGTINGGWSFAIPNLRSADLTVYFAYTPGVDELQIVWQGGPYGAVGEPGDERYYPAPAGATAYNMTLDAAPTAVRVSLFTARADGVEGGIPYQAALWLLALALAGAVSLALMGRKSTV